MSTDHQPYNGLPPYQSHSKTSKEAAISAAPNAASDRARILKFVIERGAHGATSDECQAEFRLAHQTGSARVAELLAAGLIIESGRQRKTRRNRNADVLVIAPPGTPSRDANVQRKVPIGFTEEELPQLYLQLCELCDFARAHAGPPLGPLILRLGYWLRGHAGEAAEERDRRHKAQNRKSI